LTLLAGLAHNGSFAREIAIGQVHLFGQAALDFSDTTRLRAMRDRILPIAEVP
jgi:hypothetical protein